ncbi:MAG: hypothetical protein CL920_28555 [Deltaproteobacteria bacterium]|nr:hypothetical protein [Deltaproteobacteria bacterium]
MTAIIIVLVSVIVIFPMFIKVLREYERGVVFRLGRFLSVKGPGLILLIPGVDQMVRVDLRTLTYDVPSQDIITRDNVSVKVNAVIYFRVVEPMKAIVEVESYQYATSQMAQTKLRDVLGQVELDDLLANREEINNRLQLILDDQTDPWGIKVSAVELKHVDLAPEMVRAMARQAEAERERRAKIISAEGEFQASARLAEAADTLSKHPASLSLRYLQTLVEISGENNTTTMAFPIPLDLIEPFMEAKAKAAVLAQQGSDPVAAPESKG